MTTSRKGLQPEVPLPLWPNGVPGLMEADPIHVPTMVPFPVDRGEPAGAVVVLPGGGYAGRAPHEADPIARWLNSAGIAAFVCHYRVAPYHWPRPWQDACQAIRWVRANAAEWNVNPDKVGILGFSAGGHLCSTVGTHYDLGDPAATEPMARQSCRPDALVLCYPVINLYEPFGHLGSMYNLLGDTPDEELRRSLCNETQVNGDTPPTFLWHTADDEGVPVENSLMFATSLAKYNVPFGLHVYPHGQHGLGLAVGDPEVGTWPDLCATWLKKLGF